MPTNKRDAEQVVAKALAEHADAVEELIEDKIAEGNLSVSLSAEQLPQGVNLAVLKVVAKRYEQAGWSVRAEQNQRDGLYIVIS